MNMDSRSGLSCVCVAYLYMYTSDVLRLLQARYTVLFFSLQILMQDKYGYNSKVNASARASPKVKRTVHKNKWLVYTYTATSLEKLIP